MKINFQTGDISGTEKSYAGKKTTTGSTAGQVSADGYQSSAVYANFMSDNDRLWNVSGDNSQKGKSLIEIQQEAGNVNVGIQQDYMTVMSNTMSEEDYAKMEEDGFSFKSMNPDEAVTIVDKIKAEMAEAGQIITGYNDDLDIDVLAEAVGSEALARQVAESFSDADIPLTDENIDMVGQAWDMASRLTAPDDGTVGYMIDNEMAPEIWNLYLAQNSGSSNAAAGTGRYYAEDIKGYYTQSGTDETKGIQEQIDRIIEQSSLELNDDSRADAQWLIDRGLPVTADNIDRLYDIKQCEFPVTEETFAKAAAAAIAEGKSPIHADLSQTENIYEKAAAMLSEYNSDEMWEALGDNVTARRQLEEIRLRMTAEVNVKLLKNNSDFAIDTAPMEQLIDALKKAEQEVAANYFPQADDAVEKYQLFNRTQDVVRDIPSLPVGTIGTYALEKTDSSLSEFHSVGTALRDEYIKANESYEEMMTVPRADLGDSIKKAFSNVDDILKDLDLDVNDENRRAVRILGYNHMAVTEENIEKVLAADTQVRDVVKKMTPASTLQMIRDGVNPLEKTFDELNEYFEESGSGYEEQSESYSRFLYRLEHKNEISDDEREAYIGVFRMLRQIERTDGAAVGAVVNTQAQMQFSSLLSAVRSGRFKSLDVKVEDAFGTVSQIVKNKDSISDQIAKGFVNKVDDILTEVSESPEADRAYYTEELAEVREAANVSQEAVELLKSGSVTASAENLIAAEELINGEDTLFHKADRRIKDKGTDAGKELLARAGALWEKLDSKEAFNEEYTDTLNALDEAVEELSLEADTSIDVRDMKLMHKQLNIAAAAASDEEYIIPMYIGDNLSQVHFSVRQQETGKGEVHISVDMQDDSRMEADFRLQNGVLSGILRGNSEEEVTKLQSAADIMNERLTGGYDELDGITAGEINVYRSDNYSVNNAGMDAGINKTDGAENIELYRVAKLFLQSIRQS
jgi:PAS domain-containing protein